MRQRRCHSKALHSYTFLQHVCMHSCSYAHKYTPLVVFMVRITVLLRPISALMGGTYSVDIVTDIWHDPRGTHLRTSHQHELRCRLATVTSAHSAAKQA